MRWFFQLFVGKKNSKIFLIKFLFFCPQRVENLDTHGRWEFFSLCRPNCPKQPRTSFTFYKIFYPIVSAKVSGFQPQKFITVLWTAKRIQGRSIVSSINLKFGNQFFVDLRVLYKFWTWICYWFIFVITISIIAHLNFGMNKDAPFTKFCLFL